MKKLLLAALVLSLGSMAWADVLWNQALDPLAPAYVDQEFSDFPTYSTYQVHDIVVPAGPGWTIQKITTWFINGGAPGNWTTVTQGRLNVFPKTGSLPVAGNDPAAGTVGAISIVNPTSGTAEISMNVNFNLAPGAYWVGFTPMTSFATHGQKFLGQTTGIMGDQSAARNPGGGFGIGTAWASTAIFGATMDSAIKIEGVPIPEPASLLLLGAMALLRRR